MERESVVGSVSADTPNKSITAHYFVENGVIHTSIAGRTLLSPVGNCSPRNTVKALLTSFVLQHSRRTNAKPDWQGPSAQRRSIARLSPSNWSDFMKRGVMIAVLILILVGVTAGAVSFFQGAGVNRANPEQTDLEGTYRPS